MRMPPPVGSLSYPTFMLIHADANDADLGRSSAPAHIPATNVVSVARNVSLRKTGRLWSPKSMSSMWILALATC